MCLMIERMLNKLNVVNVVHLINCIIENIVHNCNSNGNLHFKCHI